MIDSIIMVGKITGGILALIGATLFLAYTSSYAEELRNVHPFDQQAQKVFGHPVQKVKPEGEVEVPEVLFACKSTPTSINGKVYNCAECDGDARRNTCTSIMKD